MWSVVSQDRAEDICITPCTCKILLLPVNMSCACVKRSNVPVSHQVQENTFLLSQLQLLEHLLPLLLHCPLISAVLLTHSHPAFLWPWLQLCNNFFFFILKSAITEALLPFRIGSPGQNHLHLWSDQGLVLLHLEEASGSFSKKPPL